MGEYAKYNGQSVKIGTCEDMYYLRYADRYKVQPEPGNVDPARQATSLRFRFPWPDEDAIARPGHDNESHDYDRSLAVPSMKMPSGVEHYTVQFSSPKGYLVSLPCPEGQDADWLRLHKPDGTQSPVAIHRNGFAGAVHLCQQKELADGRVVPILKCGGCGGRWRMEDPAEIEALVVAFRSAADRADADTRDGRDARSRGWHLIADRLAESAQLGAEVPA